MTTATLPGAKRAFQILRRDGGPPMLARIPVELTVGDAAAELAARGGFPPEPAVTTRYALLAAPGDGGDFLLLRDDLRFGELAEHTVLRPVAQPRPA